MYSYININIRSTLLWWWQPRGLLHSVCFLCVDSSHSEHVDVLKNPDIEIEYRPFLFNHHLYRRHRNLFSVLGFNVISAKKMILYTEIKTRVDMSPEVRVVIIAVTAVIIIEPTE